MWLKVILFKPAHQELQFEYIYLQCSCSTKYVKWNKQVLIFNIEIIYFLLCQSYIEIPLICMSAIMVLIFLIINQYYRKCLIQFKMQNNQLLTIKIFLILPMHWIFRNIKSFYFLSLIWSNILSHRIIVITTRVEGSW